MAAPRFATPLTSSSSRLFRCAFATTATPALRPCCHALRQASKVQSAHMSTKRKMQTSTYHPYSLATPGPPPPRNMGSPETSIGKDLPQLFDNRPPSSPTQEAAALNSSTSQTNITATEKEAQTAKPTTPDSTAKDTAATSQTPAKPKPRSRLRAARKSAIILTPVAVEKLRDLLNQPDPKLIKVGTKNRGCSGLSYNLEYVDKAGAFDETVKQDGVSVLIDSKALFSVIGSEMDYVEDKLSERFVFRNPNIKGECGCGESFMV